MYILAELDGSLFDRPVAAFHVIPYFARKHINLPLLTDLLDVLISRLRELENTTLAETDDPLEDEGNDNDSSEDKD